MNCSYICTKAHFFYYNFFTFIPYLQVKLCSLVMLTHIEKRKSLVICAKNVRLCINTEELKSINFVSERKLRFHPAEHDTCT